MICAEDDPASPRDVDEKNDHYTDERSSTRRIWGGDFTQGWRKVKEIQDVNDCGIVGSIHTKHRWVMRSGTTRYSAAAQRVVTDGHNMVQQYSRASTAASSHYSRRFIKPHLPAVSLL